jgi:hypothetical protein
VRKKKEGHFKAFGGAMVGNRLFEGHIGVDSAEMNTC